MIYVSVILGHYLETVYLLYWGFYKFYFTGDVQFNLKMGSMFYFKC